MTFIENFTFAEKHMPAVRNALGNMPAKTFFDIQTAPTKRDMEEATDLILSVSSGDIAVRIRRNENYLESLKPNRQLDWSVRVKNNGHKTEIDKLQEGFARWYFMGWSLDDKAELADWYLIDMDKIRKNNIMKRDYPTHSNYDGTVGKYIQIRVLRFNMCIVGECKKVEVVK